MLPERAAAIRAGFGVHGLNGLLITPDHGSFVNISVLLLHAAPPPDARGPEHDLSPGCCKCGECVKACPACAISDDGVNALMCLRYHMRKPEAMPVEDYLRMGRRIVGCDTCQQVCPENAALERVQAPVDLIDCMKLEKLLYKPDIDLMSTYIESYYIPETHVRIQAILAAANTGRKDLLSLIEAYIGSDDEALDRIAHWAVEKIAAL